MRETDAFVVFIATKIFVGIFALAERLQTSATLFTRNSEIHMQP